MTNRIRSRKPKRSAKKRLPIIEGTAPDPIPQVFEALEIGEHADHRVYPAEFESDAVFYRLQLDGKLLELPHLGS